MELQTHLAIQGYVMTLTVVGIAISWSWCCLRNRRKITQVIAWLHLHHAYHQTLQQWICAVEQAALTGDTTALEANRQCPTGGPGDGYGSEEGPPDL